MKKYEKLVYVGCPWFFGAVFIVCGLISAIEEVKSLQWLLMVCTGLICLSLYCVCALLVKIIEQGKVNTTEN